MTIEELRDELGIEDKSEPDRNDPAWWSTDPRPGILDRRFTDTHPRNTPGTEQYRAAQREVQGYETSKLASMPRPSDIPVGEDGKPLAVDAAGNPLSYGEIEAYQKLQDQHARLTSVPEAEYDKDGNEIILGRSGEPLSTEDVVYQRELERRERLRALNAPTPPVVTESSVEADLPSQIREAEARLQRAIREGDRGAQDAARATIGQLNSRILVAQLGYKSDPQPEVEPVASQNDAAYRRATQVSDDGQT